jgi:hypothetical protein
MKKLFAIIFPSNLTSNQKYNHKKFCSDALKIIKNYSYFLNNITTKRRFLHQFLLNKKKYMH